MKIALSRTLFSVVEFIDNVVEWVYYVFHQRVCFDCGEELNDSWTTINRVEPEDERLEHISGKSHIIVGRDNFCNLHCATRYYRENYGDDFESFQSVP